MKKLQFDIVSFLFVLLFVYAATNKLLEYDLFKAQIGKSPLILHYSSVLAWAIPSLELLTAGFLLIPRLQLLGLYFSAFLMFIFTLYLSFILTLSPYIPCSCGGILNNLSWRDHLVFNICFSALSLYGI